MIPEVWPQPFTVSPIERTPPQYVPMPPPFEASHTFSVQVLTMPSRLSSTAFRKQEIGRPRCGAAVRQDGRRRQEPQPRHVVVEPLRVRARRPHRRAPRARTDPAGFRRRADSGPAAWRGRSSSAARRALGSMVTSMARARGLGRIRAGRRAAWCSGSSRDLFACARVSRATPGLFDLPSLSPLFAGKRKRREILRTAESIDAAAGTPRPIRSLKVCPAGLLAHRSIAIRLAFPRIVSSVT